MPSIKFDRPADETAFAGSVKGDAGAAGATGDAATITVGTVTTVAAGSSAAVTNVGSSSAAIFNFDIPRGDTGETGGTGATGATGAPGSDSNLPDPTGLSDGDYVLRVTSGVPSWILHT